MESTRAKELAVKKETAQQLELFRRQREETEKAARLEGAEESTEQIETWAVRKRKRVSQKELPGVKLRKSSSAAASPSSSAPKTDPPAGRTSRDSPPKSTTLASETDIGTLPRLQETVPTISQLPTPAIEKPPPAVALGLGDYSDSD